MKSSAKQKGLGLVRVQQGSANEVPRATHAEFGQAWALILAGGEGTRLREFTTLASGTAVPKQFCSLVGGSTLLEDAIARAHGVVAPQRTCTIVSYPHRQWWSALLANEDPGNVIVQPRGRGTGVGILFSALHIAVRDPYARILILPADHHVRREAVLREGLQSALAQLDSESARPTLLGLAPDRIDTELGYIVPGEADSRGLQRVLRFVEKPDRDTARDSIADGALWNTFILAASVGSLVKLFMKEYSVLVLEMQAIVNAALMAQPRHAGWQALVDMYDRLPTIDFSKDILQPQPSALRVLGVRECGWTDLGTPRRLAETLRHLPPAASREDTPPAPFVNLAAQQERYEHHRAGAAPSRPN